MFKFYLSNKLRFICFKILCASTTKVTCISLEIFPRIELEALKNVIRLIIFISESKPIALST